ncbi:AsmA family protein [Mucilaginibacter sp. BT774]|uniref:AsmA family protein n=1 Tax=Mucilaginibacter sp. BT774 TaxID=3062276 RepID=UPI002676B76C|nr:AsmA family protein [Mucilaginibacter sp. BT774]MDO3627780.1 AsmA family protein [Mucilaginibacter sp. BT774]
MSRWLKNGIKILAGLILLVILIVIGTMLYVTYNKSRVLKMVSTELNQNLDGQITIGDMKPQLFKDFPNISLELKNVTIRDKRFAEHKHTLLDAKEFYVSLNALSMVTGKASINRIDIDNASADLYTDSTGYSNLSVFKKSPKNGSEEPAGKSVPPAFQLFSFSNLQLKVDDRSKNKLFYFDVRNVNGRMRGLDTGWRARFHLDVLARNMSFKTKNGSFVQDKTINGNFEAIGDDNGKITLNSEAVNIGPNQFKLDAVFGADKHPADFKIHLTCNQITWRQASQLVAANIKRKLDQYNISQPLAVTARIEGSFAGGNPFLYITARVRNSKVSTPVTIFDNCGFDAIFTNNFEKGKDFTDDNSVIRFTRFSGSYKQIPFNIDTGSIININKPIATGNLRADFPVADLNEIMGNKIARFTKGRATTYLRYKGDIVNYQLNKPIVTGYINIKNADVTYIPEKLKLINSSLSMNFTKDDLVLRNIRLQSGHSVITMDGRVKNFMNLYYTAPEKMLLTWEIRSKQLYLAEFLSFLEGNGARPSAESKPIVNSGNAIDQLSNVLEKGTAAMHLDVSKVYYNKFLATDVHADLLTSEDAIVIKNVGLKHAGGFLKMNGSIQRGEDLNKLKLNTVISHVDVNEFFKAFDNFGLSDFTADNLKGLLSAKTAITAGITDDGKLAKNSINGNLDVNLQQGQLLNFKPLYSVGKFAFPFRDLKNIRVQELNAHFDVNGDMFKVYPLKLSSSAINMDISGVYGISKGTDLAIDVPLRNPKNDTTITDPAKLEKKRYKGIILHLHAKADSTGKIKIGLGNDRKKKD